MWGPPVILDCDSLGPRSSITLIRGMRDFSKHTNTIDLNGVQSHTGELDEIYRGFLNLVRLLADSS